MLRRDPEATARAGFTDWRSYVAFDGRRYLFGKDVAEARQRIFERDKGHCRYCGAYCDWDSGELHHLTGGHGRQRCWDDDNLIWSCGPCHKKQHVQVKWRSDVLALARLRDM